MKKEVNIDILLRNNENFLKKIPIKLHEEFLRLSNMAYELGGKDYKIKLNK